MNEPHDLTWFIDRDLGRRFAEALQSEGLHVERADDHFRNDTPDDDWLPIVASRGWVAVTRDKRIRYSPLALTALMTSGARLFVIVGNLTAADTATLFLRHKNRIARCVAHEKSAFIAKVRRDGVTVWLGYREWMRQKR